MKKITITFLSFFFAFPAIGERLPIIPKPQHEERLEGHFPITAETVVRYDDCLHAEAERFAADLGQRLGREVQTVDGRLRIFTPNAIYLNLAEGNDLKEAYMLEARPDVVKITGNHPASAFHATRRLLQLIPLDGEPVLPASNR